MLFSCTTQLDTSPEVRFNFGSRGIRELPPDPLAGQIARQFVQLQSDPKPTLARHLAISIDLTLESCIRIHCSDFYFAPTSCFFFSAIISCWIERGTRRYFENSIVNVPWPCVMLRRSVE